MSRVEIGPAQILFEDADLLAVDKPAGLVSHATVDPGRDHLVAAVSRLLAARDGAVGHLTQLHRLDRDTSGVVLFSRSAPLDAAVGAAFAQRMVEKVYLAVVSARVELGPGETTWRDYLSKARDRSGRMRVVRSGGQPAITTVRLRARMGDRLLVEARPRTGRTHQIRVQFAQRELPIVGDDLYGGETAGGETLCLHAWRLAFTHPRTGARLEIVAPPPVAFTVHFPDLVTELSPE
jgi:RluA family pseudouridine synthase